MMFNITVGFFDEKPNIHFVTNCSDLRKGSGFARNLQCRMKMRNLASIFHEMGTKIAFSIHYFAGRNSREKKSSKTYNTVIFANI